VQEWYSGASSQNNAEDQVRKSIMVAIAFAMGGLALVAGCNNQQDKASNAPAPPKWKGLPYRISFDTPPAKPDPSGVTIPIIKYTANPDALETRASLVVHFDTSTAAKQGPMANQMILGPTDIKGTDGALPADYMVLADQGLARFFAAYGIKGKIKISVALARSSLSSQAEESEVESKRLSDWLPIEVAFKNPHPGR